MNLVERFFGELTSEVVREGSFQSLRQLVRAIESYLAERNQNPKKYVWRASGQKILEKIQRAKEALAAADVIMTKGVVEKEGKGEKYSRKVMSIESWEKGRGEPNGKRRGEEGDGKSRRMRGKEKIRAR